MNKTYYVCKYTPVELLEALGGECEILNDMPEGFDLAEQVAHPNICGFGKAVLEAVLAGKVKELVLVNCCDTIRSVYDILEDSGVPDHQMPPQADVQKNFRTNSRSLWNRILKSFPAIPSVIPRFQTFLHRCVFHVPCGKFCCMYASQPLLSRHPHRD